MAATLADNLIRGLERNPARTSSPAAARLRKRAIDYVRTENLISEANFSFRIVPVEQALSGTLVVGGEHLHAPRLIPSAGRLTALACGVATIGAKFTDRISSLFQDRRAALAVGLDQLGSEALFALSRRLQDRIAADVRKQQLTMAGELRPGDPGMPISDQPALLKLAGASEIGITVEAGMLMTPRKSLSMVLGVGTDLPTTSWSRCDDCPSRSKCGHVAATSNSQVSS